MLSWPQQHVASLWSEEMAADTEEIADLLDQCTPEELTNILKNLEEIATRRESSPLLGQGVPRSLALAAPPAPPGSSLAESLQAAQVAQAPHAPPRLQSAAAQPQLPCTKRSAPTAGSSLPPFAPAPPSAPSSGSRRPQPTGLSMRPAGPTGADMISMGDLRSVLTQHGSHLLSEVQALVDRSHAPESDDTVAGFDLHMLVKTLAERDLEVKQMEAQLAVLQAELSAKDRCIAGLSLELGQAERDVRNKRVGLQAQQFKIEERRRCNAELEQQQQQQRIMSQQLQPRLDEVSLGARQHMAANPQLAAPISSSYLPTQGSLPWSLRKTRPPYWDLPDGLPHRY